MKNNSTTSRPRWRISEELAAELAHERRQSNFRSWEEFHRDLLRRWRENPDASPSKELLKEIEAIVESVVSRVAEVQCAEFNAKLDTLVSHAESQSLINGVLQAAQQNSESINQRIHDLLARAFQEGEAHHRRAKESAIDQLRSRRTY